MISTALTIYSVDEKLPEHGQRVFARYDDGQWMYAKFRKGLSKAERAALDDSDPRKKTIFGEDEHGNNLKPYRWENCYGLGRLFGQEVDLWCEPPEVPKYSLAQLWR